MVVLPRQGALRTRRRRQQARRAKRTEAGGPTPSGHAQLAALFHARAHILHLRRRRPCNSRVRGAKQQEPTSATSGTSACAPACTRAMWRARWRGASSLATRARSSVRPTSHTCRVGGCGGKGGGGPPAPPHHPRACVRADLRLACAKSPRLARCTAHDENSPKSQNPK